jgi:hypothetical protein
MISNKNKAGAMPSGSFVKKTSTSNSHSLHEHSSTSNEPYIIIRGQLPPSQLPA